MTGVPDDKAMSTLPIIASIQLETVEKNVQEEIHAEAESVMKDTHERKRSDNNYEENMKALEV